MSAEEEAAAVAELEKLIAPLERLRDTFVADIEAGRADA